MGKASESIFDGDKPIIPLADVQHIKLHWYPTDNLKTRTNYRGIKIFTKHTRWDPATLDWANNIYLDKDEAGRFLRMWRTYRYEIESETLQRPMEGV